MRKLLYRLSAFLFIFMFSTGMISKNSGVENITRYEPQPLYDGIWGTIYHAEKRQCDDTPLITGDGSRINPYRASEQRWIAISQDMLDCEYRQTLVNDTTLFRGKISYGDTVWIQSSNPRINGWWIVHDTKNKRYRGTIDFLQTKGDGTLYNYDKYWSGKFEDIKIYSMNEARFLGLNPMT